MSPICYNIYKIRLHLLCIECLHEQLHRQSHTCTTLIIHTKIKNTDPLANIIFCCFYSSSIVVPTLLILYHCNNRFHHRWRTNQTTTAKNVNNQNICRVRCIYELFVVNTCFSTVLLSLDSVAFETITGVVEVHQFIKHCFIVATFE